MRQLKDPSKTSSGNICRQNVLTEIKQNITVNRKLEIEIQ